MATLTIRKVPAKTLKALKARARRNGRSMEAEVRRLLEEHYSTKAEILKQIRESWKTRPPGPSAEEIDRWIETGRE